MSAGAKATLGVTLGWTEAAGAGMEGGAGVEGGAGGGGGLCVAGIDGGWLFLAAGVAVFSLAGFRTKETIVVTAIVATPKGIITSVA